MEKLFEVIFDLETETETIRPYSDEEIAAVEAEKAKIEAETQLVAAKELEKIAVLNKLGITEDEAKLLLS